jgi:hypothetical protein
MFASMTYERLGEGIAEIEATFLDSDVLEIDFVSVLISGAGGGLCNRASSGLNGLGVTNI